MEQRNNTVVNIQDYRNNKSLVSSTLNNEFNSKVYNDFKGSDKGGIIEMENEKYILKLIDNMCDNNKELKKDIVESEKRIAENIRISEERMDKRVESVLSAMEKHNNSLENKINNMEIELKGKMGKVEAKADNSFKWIAGTCLATIIGIATMVITIVVAK